MSLEQRIKELEVENARLRNRLAMRSGLHVAHYSAQHLATIYNTSDRFWLDRIKDGRLGPTGQPGGPINLNPGSARGDWRIPGDRVWELFIQEPLMADAEEVVFARTPGELKRKAAA